MNIRQAILKAADHIERHPSRFDFDSIDIPQRANCGTPGCAVGWVAYFRGLRDEEDFSTALGVDACVFYERMAAFDNHNPFKSGNWGPWRLSATHCARNLRLYAEKYHPANAGLPDAVRAIFTTPQIAPPPATAADWMALHDRAIDALKNA